MGLIEESFSGIQSMKFRRGATVLPCCSQVGGSESDLSEPFSAACVCLKLFLAGLVLP